MNVELLTPTLERRPHHVDALKCGWPPDNLRGRIAEDQPAAFGGTPSVRFRIPL
jgi:hypothetical protein